MPTRFQTVSDVLDAYARRDATRRFAEGALALALICGLAVALLAGVDLALRPAPGVRLALLLAAIITALVAAAALLWRAKVRPGATALAVEVEARSPSPFANTLVTAVDCADPAIGQRFGYSSALVDACKVRALEIASGVDVAALPPFERVTRLALAAGSLACLWVVLIAARGPQLAEVLAYRYLVLLAPASAGPVTLDVKPGNRTVLEGSRMDVSLGITGRAFSSDEPPLLKRRVDGAPRPESVALAPNGPGQWATFFPAVLKAFHYHVEAGPFESPEFTVRVVPPPRITKLSLEYAYPAYTALKPHTQDRPPYDVSGPVGTRVTVHVECSKPLASARLVMPGKPVALAGGPSWSGSFEISQSGQYSVEVTDTDGFHNPSPERWQILAVVDRSPRVLVLEPGRDLSLKPSELTTLPLKIEVSDDYGIRQVKLKAKITQKVEYDFMSTDEEYPIATPAGSPQKLALDWTWDFRKKVLQPGDSITYFVEAADHFPAKDHAGVSKTYTIKFPFAAEVLTKTAEEQDQQLASVEDVAAKQKALEERIEKVMKDVRNQREVGYKERKELDNIVQRQKEIKEKSSEISNRMKDTLETLKKNDLVDPGTVKKLSDIQQLFNELADSKMKENMERLKELMQNMKMDPEKLSKMMQDFDRNKYAQQLDRILKSLKRMKQLQELNRAAKTAEELAQKQDELRRETAGRQQDQKKTEDLAAKQQDLQRDTDHLVKQLPKLADEMSKEFKENAEDLDKLAQEAKNQDPSQDMQQATDSLKQNQGSKAYQHQSDAHQKLSKMRAAMKQVQDQMQQKQSQIDLQALVALIGDGLKVSKVQEQVYADAGAGASSPDLMRKFCLDLAGRQYVAVRGSLRFEKQFDGAFPDDLMFKNQFISQIGQLIDDMTEAKKNYEELRQYSAKQLSERSLTRLNIVLVKLLDAMNQLQDQQNSDSMQSFFDQMQKMIEGQRKLNQQAQRLKPNEQMSPFQMQMMQQMAVEQEMVRQAMEKMASKYDKAKDLLGDMEQLAKDMKKVEEQLKKFDRSQETRDLQDHILNKMLDLQTSANKKGKSEKREAEQAKLYRPQKAAALSADLLEVRQKLHENLSRESYPPQHKKIVEDYFSSFGK